ncbi:MAG TPA: YjbQ family protein [Acidobacteria bacterium]|nr:YjbQ family protein [Acidobacteriota bacterium]
MPAADLDIATRGAGLYEITSLVARAVADSGVDEGVAVVFVRHTSASLLIQENADPSVQRDLLAFFEGLAPESGGWEHASEGPDDMPAHLRAALTHTSEVIPVAGGRLLLGTWQGLYLFEHRRAPHTRRVHVRILADR